MGRWPDHVGLWAWPKYPLEWQLEAYLVAKELMRHGIPYKVHRGDGKDIILADDDLTIGSTSDEAHWIT